MTNIGILTFHRANNFGAVLQAYALCTYLNGIDGVHTEVIDYRSPVVERRNAQLPFARGVHQSLKKRLKGLANYKNTAANRKVFDRFRAEHLPLSAAVNRDGLKNAASDYDILICGSDQIWNLDITGSDGSYMLDFAAQTQGVCSYAASIGDAGLIGQRTAEYTELLSRFRVISVRESSAKAAIEELFPSQVRQDVDPVFLLNREAWSAMSTRIDRKPYVLAFKMGSHQSGERMLHAAKEIAKKKGCDVVYLSDKDLWYKYRDLHHFGAATPEQFLGLIKSADTVVTNSFHATAFSIIFNQHFFVDTDIPRAERIMDLLRLAGLEKRAVRLYSDQSEIEIDWPVVNQNINDRVYESKLFLQKISRHCLFDNI